MNENDFPSDIKTLEEAEQAKIAVQNAVMEITQTINDLSDDINNWKNFVKVMKFIGTEKQRKEHQNPEKGMVYFIKPQQKI